MTAKIQTSNRNPNINIPGVHQCSLRVEYYHVAFTNKTQVRKAHRR